MDPALVIIEGAKLFLQGYFNYMRMNGKTPEEAEALYKDERAQFDKNEPGNLEDV
jgi:hypothetical protein